MALPFPCDLRSFHTSPDELLIGNNLSVMAVSERLAALAAGLRKLDTWIFLTLRTSAQGNASIVTMELQSPMEQEQLR